YGSPLVDAPSGVYTGAGYNIQNGPIYNYNGVMGPTFQFGLASSLQLSQPGRQFITSRENGSYRPIQTGNPPQLEIGYGHTLTPTEISTSIIIIKGNSV